MLLERQSSRVKPQLDIPGVLLVSSGLFCVVYGFSNAATHGWHAASTYGFLIAGVALLAAFAFWQTRAANPLLPPRVVLDRNRGGAYASMLVASAAMFGTFLFLTYYLQQTLGYTPIITGFAVLPIIGGIAVSANVSNIVLMPKLGPKPLVAAGMLIAAGAAAWFAQLGPDTSYVGGVLGPLILTGVGLGMVIAPSINTGTYGVAPQDAGVASATVTVGQQLGASIGTSLLNTIFASAVASYFAAHAASARTIGVPALTKLALLHGYDAGFAWTAGILAGGSIVAGIVFRRGPLATQGAPAGQPAGAMATELGAGPAISA
jgi:Major Facilitator Superfamily